MELEKVKSYFWLALTVLLAGLVVNLVFFVMPAVKKYGDSLYPVRSVTVSAEGKTVAAPDLAEVSFSVISRGINPEDLADINNQKMSAVIQNLKSQGIDAKDIKTTSYNLSPDYRWDPQTERNYITGYTLTQTVNVKIRDLGKAAKIVGGLTPLGVNQIGGINFTVENPEKFLAEARSEAFRKAHEKAASMAAQNGLRLGKIVNISEYQGGPIVPYFGAKAGEGFGGDGKIALPTIEPGTQEITMQVSVTYALR